jgi:hypothetical protein
MTQTTAREKIKHLVEKFSREQAAGAIVIITGETLPM